MSRRARALAGSAALAALVTLGAPEVSMRSARARAEACLAQASAPRAADLPDCTPLVGGFSLASRAPWTRTQATREVEELEARVARARYVDAAVGAPDPVAQSAALDGVRRAEAMIAAGSRRLALEELGPAVTAPSLGTLAMSVGDRATLLEHPEAFGAWPTRVAVLEAAMLEADFHEVDAIAHRYAEWDPRDADLRTQLGAALCLGSPHRGVEILERIPGDRAAKRYAGMARDFGEVWAVMLACHDKAGLSLPEEPTERHAGIVDRPDVARATRLRLAREGDALARELSEASTTLTRTDGGGVDPTLPGARAALVAAVFARGATSPTPAHAARLVTPGRDEAPIGPRALRVASIWEEGSGVGPLVPVEWLEESSARLAALAAAEAAGTSEGEGSAAAAEERSLREARVEVLRDAARGMGLRAAAEWARRGDLERAIGAAQSATRGATEAWAEPLSAASAAYAAGDPARALALLAVGTPPPAEQHDARVGWFSVEALARAASGDREGATRAARALAAHQAEATPDLEAEALWIRVAFDALDAPPSPVLFPWQRPGRPGVGGPGAAISWSGAASLDAAFRARGHEADETRAALFTSALAASDEDRRAFRYVLFDDRGDVPRFALPYVVASARLLGPDASTGATEAWLDALLAFDGRRWGLRARAFTRAEAARMRGDAVAAAAWDERLAVLRRVAARDEDLEIAAFLGL